MSREAAELARKAVEVLRECGHAKGAYQEPDGRVCLVGALSVAAGVSPNAQTDLVRSVKYTITRMLGVVSTAVWNDAPDRTQADVEQILLQAAAALDVA
jgi:hypothetical protein